MINIKSDSRKVKPGDIFVAVKCEVNDGHDYIESAIKNGASKIIAEYGEYSIETEIVPNSRLYLESYLEKHYNSLLEEINIIGITGTNGKTTSAYFLYQALNKLGVKAAYLGTIGFYLDKKVCDLPNTTVDICDLYDLCMQAYSNEYQTIIMEVSSQALYNGRLNTISFDYAIFSNLTQDHLDCHKTMGNYALAKQKLFKQLKKTGTGIINIDDKYHEYFLLEENKNITYGFSESDYQIVDYKMEDMGIHFNYRHLGEIIPIYMNIVGEYNIYNMMSVIALLTEFGFSIEDIQKVIPTIVNADGRLDIVHYKSNYIVIDYAHTSDAIEKVITTVQKTVKGKTYVVFGCTGDRDRLKRPIMTNLVGRLADYFIITSDDLHFESPEQIVDDMTKDLENTNYEVCLDRGEAIKIGIDKLEENDVLFILGKGHEEYIIVHDDKIPFKDKNVVTKYLEELEKP